MHLPKYFSRKYSQSIVNNLISTLEKEISYALTKINTDTGSIQYPKLTNTKIYPQELKKKIILKNKTLEIEFSSRPPFKNLSTEAFLYEGKDDIYNNNDITYTITLKKQKKSIKYCLFSNDSEMYIKTIEYHDDKYLIEGRRFKDLFTTTQEEFISLLNNEKLGSVLANFIDYYSLYRDQQLNIEWMKKIKEHLTIK